MSETETNGTQMGEAPEIKESNAKEESELKENSKDKDDPEVKKEDIPKTEVKNEDISKTEEKGDGQTDITLSTLDKQIIRQIEYYFGDINLPRDKFLQQQIKLDDGWLPWDVMLKFKRLHSLCSDPEVIVNSLAKSTAMLMEISEDKKKIRRSPNCPLPVLTEERRKELMTRTTYCKGFPQKDTTLDEILAYFAQYGPFENVQMRYYPDKATKTYVFKGSVFVMFKTVELAEKFLALESVKYKDVELVRKWQSEYLEDKKKQRDERKNLRRGGAGGGAQKNEPKKDGEPKKETENNDVLPKGAILHLKGFPGDMTREDIKEQLIKLGADVAFIDFSKGDSEAWVRLQGENSTVPILEKLKETKFEVGGVEIESRALEGEEETKFLEKTQEQLDKIRSSHRNRRGSNRGRGGGRGRFWGGKRKGSPVSGGTPAKQEAK